MKITIEQVEIEAALRQYAGNMFNFNEGSEVRIELKATRGEAGATAIIDVRPEGGFAAEDKLLNTPAPRKSAVEQPTKTITQTVKDAKAEGVGEGEGSDGQGDGAGSGEANSDAAAQSTAAAAEAGPADTDGAAEAPKPGKSLFGGVKRPNNAAA